MYKINLGNFKFESEKFTLLEFLKETLRLYSKFSQMTGFNKNLNSVTAAKLYIDKVVLEIDIKKVIDNN